MSRVPRDELIACLRVELVILKIVAQGEREREKES